jgi:hypothetical protein
MPKNNHSMPFSLFDYAKKYGLRGWAVLPVPFRSKRPLIKGWQNLTITQEELGVYFNGHPQNIGILLGERSGGLVDIDLDSKEAVEMADFFLPKTQSVFGRKSKPRSHRLYICEDASYRKFTSVMMPNSGDLAIHRVCIVEIRTSQNGKGLQTVFPPSVHEDGEIVEWYLDGDPAIVTFQDLNSAVGKLASACLFVSHWRPGIRRELTLAISGALQGNGFTEKETKTFITAICQAARDEDADDRIKVVSDTANKLRNKERIFGLPKLADLTNQDCVKTICEWLKIKTGNPIKLPATPLDQPKPLAFNLRPVAAIEDEYLPDVLVEWLRPASKVIGCPYDFLVLSAIVTAGILIGARVRLRPLERSDWLIVSNLYGGLVGLPSTKKTPALDEVLRPVLELQKKAREELKTRVQDYEVESRLYEKAERDVFKDVQSLAHAKERLADLVRPEKPTLRRYLTNDVTTSKLIHFLSENPNGLLLFRDELMGWLRSLFWVEFNPLRFKNMWRRLIRSKTRMAFYNV